MSKWQDIASAPREGRILGFMPNLVEQGDPYMAVIWWDDELEADDWDEDADQPAYHSGWTAGRADSWGYNENVQEFPTHWMPLPDAPTTPSTEGQGE